MDKKEKVYSLLKKVPKGKVTTYKALADKCSLTPRQVGRILSLNHYPIKVPCHRVVKSDRSLGGFTWKGKRDVKKKIELLRAEGILVRGNKVLNFKLRLWLP